jgi:hypothetical protein
MIDWNWLEHNGVYFVLAVVLPIVWVRSGRRKGR